MARVPPVTQFLSAAREHLAELDAKINELTRDREIEATRVEAFEQVLGITKPGRAVTASLTHLTHPAPQTNSAAVPAAPTLSHAAPRKPGRQAGDHRAPPGAWKGVFRQLVGKETFNYDDVVAAAEKAAIETTKPSARVRVSRMKEGGYVEPVEDGVFRITDAGKKYFEG